MPRMENAKGEALYYNVIMKNGKIQYALKAIGDTVIIGRDRQKRKYRAFSQEAQADRSRDKHNRKVPKASSKEFLLYWLNHDGVSLRDLLAEPYRFASLPSENILYAEELYLDTLSSGCENRIYPLSPFAEDGLLSPAVFEEEESRRLKLSHGYSQAEKEQRIAAIHEVSAAYSGSNLDRYNP